MLDTVKYHYEISTLARENQAVLGETFEDAFMAIMDVIEEFQPASWSDALDDLEREWGI